MRIVAFCLLFVLGAGAPCRAAIILDYSPGATGASVTGPWQNQAGRQNFAETFSFSTAEILSGMDIYSGNGLPFVGQSVTVRLWSDIGGIPDALLSETVETIDIVDSDGTDGDPGIVRAHATFLNPLSLSANTTYWIGMSGTGSELGQVGIDGSNAPGDNTAAIFGGAGYQRQAEIGDMAFRLENAATDVVPEPASLAIWGGIGIAGLVAWRRKRSQGSKVTA